MASIQNLATMVFTGNNLESDEDLINRSVFIRLESEKKAADRVFEIEEIIAYSIKNRATLFSSIYTIFQDWNESRKTEDIKATVSHRFKYWAKILSGIMNNLNNKVKDQKNRDLSKFLANQNEETLVLSEEEEAWIRFRNAVFAAIEETKNPEAIKFGESMIDPPEVDEIWTAKDVFKIASFEDSDKKEDQRFVGENIFGGLFKGSNEYHEPERRINLGYYLRSNMDRIIENYKFIRCGKKKGVAAYKFVKLESGSES